MNQKALSVQGQPKRDPARTKMEMGSTGISLALVNLQTSPIVEVTGWKRADGGEGGFATEMVGEICKNLCVAPKR